MALVNAKTLANVFGITESRVHQLVKDGLPKELRGKYDLLKCVRWYVKYLQTALEKKAIPTADGGFAGEREERIRLLRADADLREMELAKERGQLVALPDVESTLTDLVLTTKARIMAIAPRVAPELVGETSRVMIQAKIEKACKEALAYLAKADPNGSAITSERAD
jgi:phage terminase Nu1 subunit (DNA packaging protein)